MKLRPYDLSPTTEVSIRPDRTDDSGFTYYKVGVTSFVEAELDYADVDELVYTELSDALSRAVLLDNAPKELIEALKVVISYYDEIVE